ncbi:copper amine oxidase domain protein [Desulfofarcimen acetoxidans DSM 771]|uniref:Copper amine oxidase domain protein n=1 Tax=Desulfofarcimen acetoxidans (strain ATCC 49208 / DSM 771 / KCTC 5769 / VKM B-1644 / 5575) TaxID=485916 RepID=C8W6F8_DESAS|nr:stalk domain-containing protein [Desulfofarcimen acetoxidans]ACV62247.1 copper amine oxidase domain protein [Desulfofarcimen acetoxidans DSM 771]
MKVKPFIIIFLSLLLCFSAVFSSSAALLSAKDLLIDKINNYKLPFNKDFYNKTSSDISLEINKFNGTVKEQAGDYTGSKIAFNVQLDEPNKAIKLNYDANIQKNSCKGDIYLTEDRIIFSKDIISLIKNFNIDELDSFPLLEQGPDYLYMISGQLKPVWEQMQSYQSQKLPVEYQDFMLFIVEAIPDKYINQSSGEITIKLDQSGFEDVLYCLVTKVFNEKERFADIIYKINKYTFEAQGLNPEAARNLIISGFAEISPPTREEIHAIGSFLDVSLLYSCSLQTYGTGNFEINMAIKAPDQSVKGSIDILSKSVTNKDNYDGSYLIKINFEDDKRKTLDGSVSGAFNYKASSATSDMKLDLTAKDNAAGEVYFDIGATIKSKDKINQALQIKVPELNTSNSINITDIMPAPGKTNQQVKDIFIDGKRIDCPVNPKIAEKGIMLPVRIISEALGYQVNWIEPNEISITGKNKVITLFVNQKTYTVNGQEKELEMAPYVENNSTMVLMDFISQELGVSINLSGGNLYIIKAQE